MSYPIPGDPKRHPYRVIDLASDYELILAFSKVSHFLEVLPHLLDEQGNRIITLEEILVFRKVFEPKLDKVLAELVRNYNLKIETLKKYAESTEEQSGGNSTSERKKIVIWSASST